MIDAVHAPTSRVVRPTSVPIGTRVFAFVTRYYPIFAVSLWIFVPELRRLIDWQIGFNSISIVSFLPVLSLLAPAFLWLRRRQGLTGPMALMGYTMGAVLVYALYIAWASSNLIPGMYQMSLFLLPMGFALWFVTHDNSPANLNFDRFCTGLMCLVAISAVYGLIQYANPPPWDVAWVANSGLNSIGEPVPFGLRIFGTLNAPGTFADVLFIAILLNLRFVQKGHIWRIVLLLPMLAALGLSLVRSGWLALVLGLIVFGIMTPKRAQFIGAACILIVLGFTAAMNLNTIFGSTSGANQGLAQRFSSLGDLQNDDSAEARQELLAASWSEINSSPLGLGLGATGTAAKLSSAQETADVDNGYIARLLEFGYFGFVGYLIVLGTPLVVGLKAFVSARAARDAESQNVLATCFATQIALIAVETSTDHHLAFSGIAFWVTALMIFVTDAQLRDGTSVVKRGSDVRAPA